MHDVHGKKLKVGDVVNIPCNILTISEVCTEYCNVSVETVHGRRPDGLKEKFFSLNTGRMELVEK